MRVACAAPACHAVRLIAAGFPTFNKYPMPMRNTPQPNKTGSKNQTRRAAPIVLAAAAGLLAGCAGIQSALDPQGPQAQAIANISWAMFWGAAFILLLVMALALYAFLRPAGASAPAANLWIGIGGLAFPAVVLSALLVYGTHAMGNLRAQAGATPEIEVVAHRWWWEVNYLGPGGALIASANEIRIPAGRPVVVSLRSQDVIHSLWVPNLAGKMDLVPGRSNRIVLHADRPGMYRGQCAEFCGAQHARMALHVVAQTPEEHTAWLAAQRMPAGEPNSRLAKRGRKMFATYCMVCHSVRGHSSATQPGPDLTHVAGRNFLAAGTLYNNRDNMMALITHSQDIKPGSGMPSHPYLDENALHALVEYLEGLK